MYDLVTELEKIGDWNIVKNNLYAIQDNQVKKFNLKGKFINNIYTLKKYWGVNFYNDFFHIYTMYSENTFVDYDKKVLLEKDNFNFYHIFTPNRYIGFDRTIKKVVNQDKVILFNERINLHRVISNYFIFTNKHKNIIFTIDLNRPEHPLWQFELSQLGIYKQGNLEYPLKISEFSGIYKNTLVCTLNNGGILLLDIENGKLVKYFEDADITVNLAQKEKGSNIFWGLKGTMFIEVDIEKKQITGQNFYDDYLKDYYNSLAFFNIAKIYDKLIYFGVGDDIIGIFNPETEKIIWSYKFEFEKPHTMLTGGKQGLQISSKNICTIDTEGNLYIFEKTTDEQI